MRTREQLREDFLKFNPDNPNDTDEQRVEKRDKTIAQVAQGLGLASFAGLSCIYNNPRPGRHVFAHRGNGRPYLHRKGLGPNHCLFSPPHEPSSAADTITTSSQSDLDAADTGSDNGTGSGDSISDGDRAEEQALYHRYYHTFFMALKRTGGRAATARCLVRKSWCGLPDLARRLDSPRLPAPRTRPAMSLARTPPWLPL